MIIGSWPRDSWLCKYSLLTLSISNLISAKKCHLLLFSHPLCCLFCLILSSNNPHINKNGSFCIQLFFIMPCGMLEASQLLGLDRHVALYLQEAASLCSHIHILASVKLHLSFFNSNKNVAQYWINVTINHLRAKLSWWWATQLIYFGPHHGRISNCTDLLSL